MNVEHEVNKDDNEDFAETGTLAWADLPISVGKLAMAFVPTENAPARSLWAMSLAWTNELVSEMIFVREACGRVRGNSKIELPYVALRAAFHIRLQQLLRLDTGMGLSFMRAPLDRQPVFALLSGTEDTRACAQATITSCLIHWFENLRAVVRNDDAGLAALDRAERIAKAGQAFILANHGIHTLPWRASPTTHTSSIRPKDRDTDRFAYAALAEEAAIALIGHELLPGAGALRRVLDGDPGRNRAVLLTPPVRVDEGEFSFCLTLHVETIPAYGQPVVVFDLSKRRWIHGPLKDRFGARTIKGQVFVDALPDRVLSFSSHRADKVGNVYRVEACDAFGYIAATYGLPLGLTSARKMAVRDYPDVDTGCQIRLTYANGVTAAKHPLDVGIPEKDWVDAFKAAAKVLQPIGLVPMEDIAPIRLRQGHSSTLASHVTALRADSEDDDAGDADDARKIINIRTMLDALRSTFAPADSQFLQRYGFASADVKISKNKLSNADQSERLGVVQAINEYAVKGLNSDGSALLLLVYDRNYPKTEVNLVRDMASVLFRDGIELQSHFLPPDTHGPQIKLPENSAGTEKRFKARVLAWEALAKRVRAVTATGRKVYCLVMAPKWYEGEHGPLHDDTINKAAARNALITLGGAMSQYLLPLQKTKDGKVDLENFSQRVQSALKDLLLAHSGSAIPFGPLAKAFFTPDTMPQEVVGITVVRNQSGRVNKSDPSFVLTAFRQRIESGQCDIRFAYAKGGTLKITEWTNLASGIEEIAAATPCWLSSESDGRMRQAVTKERYQDFVKTVLDDCQDRGTNAVVLIDSTNASSLWPWLADQRLDPAGIFIGTHYKNMQQNWKDLRIVRTRQQIAPLLVDDKIRSLREFEDGPVLEQISAPTSTTGLFKVGQADSGPQAFWSITPTGSQVKRGSSCYRQTRNTKRAPGTPNSGFMEVRTVPAHTGQWPTPNALEFAIGLMRPTDDPKKLAMFCHNLRWQSLHYDDPTALPVPLFFEKVVRQYVAKFAIGDATDKEDAEE